VVVDQVDVDMRGPVEVQRQQPGDGRLARAGHAGDQVDRRVLATWQPALRGGGKRLVAKPSLPLPHHRGKLGPAAARTGDRLSVHGLDPTP